MNHIFENGFNAGLDRAIVQVKAYPAESHGALKIPPHECAAQVRDEIVAALEFIRNLKFQ